MTVPPRLTELEEEVTVRASWAWFGLFLFGVLMLAVMLWSFLDGPVNLSLDLASDMSTSSRGDEGIRRVRLIWEYWPLWGAALSGLLIAYRRAISETGGRY